jgi:energy-coupling factor transporter ATP-binding protein EcfA2
VSKGKNSIVGIAVGVLVAQGIRRVGPLLRRMAWRWRRILAPVWTAGAIWGVSVLLRWHSPEWAWLGAGVAVAGSVLGVFGPRLSEKVLAPVMKLIPVGLDRGRDGVLDRPLERIYLVALAAWTGTYVALRIAMGGSAVTALLWQVGLLVFGGSWWYHRRVRVAGRADKYARKWGKIRDGRTAALELKALQGSKPVAVMTVGNSARMRVRLAEGVTADHVTRGADALASYYKMRPGSVFPKADPDSARHVWFEFIPNDPWEGKLTHPLPEAGSISLRATGGMFELGVTAGGEPVRWRLQHTLVIGQTGAGKSMLLESILLWLMAARGECMVAGIDMASGATLGMWRSVLALPLATDTDSAVALLERILAFIVAREVALGLNKEGDDEAPDSVDPAEDHPWLVLIIDEFPDLIAEGGPAVVALLGRIGKRGRKVGLRLLFLSQNGSKADLGSKELQAQMRCTIGLRLDQHASKVLWGPELTRQGWSSTNLANGCFLLRDDDHVVPEAAKGWYSSPRERRTRIAEARDIPVRMEPNAQDALHGVGNAAVLAEVAATMPRSDSIPMDEVLTLLRDDGPHTAEQVVTLLGATDERPEPVMARATVYRRLRKHLAKGHAHQVGSTYHYGQANGCATCTDDSPPQVVDGEVG